MFVEMLQRQRHICPDIIRLTIITECVAAGVRHLIRSASDGLWLRDWHLGNGPLSCIHKEGKAACDLPFAVQRRYVTPKWNLIGIRETLADAYWGRKR